MLIDPLPRSKRVAVRFAQFVFIEYFFSFFDFSIDFVTHSFKEDSVVRIIGLNPNPPIIFHVNSSNTFFELCVSYTILQNGLTL